MANINLFLTMVIPNVIIIQALTNLLMSLNHIQCRTYNHKTSQIIWDNLFFKCSCKEHNSLCSWHSIISLKAGNFYSLIINHFLSLPVLVMGSSLSVNCHLMYVQISLTPCPMKRLCQSPDWKQVIAKWPALCSRSSTYRTIYSVMNFPSPSTLTFDRTMRDIEFLNFFRLRLILCLFL